jgi:hypothetical protein
MLKEQFKPYIGQVIQHKHSDRTALLLSIDEGPNGGLLVQWVSDPYKVSLPACDFQPLKGINHA